MTDAPTLDAYGMLTEPATLKIERLLPGPVERVWAYLTDSDKRRQWLAAGDMTLAVGAPFKLTWRNNELTDPPGNKPADFGDEHSMETRITELHAPYRLAFAWGERGEVVIDLDPRGDKVLLTLVHKRISDRRNEVMIGAGWHAHLDILAARISGTRPEPFWDHWLALKEEYEARIPK
ncbi:SRPBCC family protein [Rhizobium sp. NRK18]|uniref:SRPBCC family protein n=1 Tax=Rhizobium sp. NRK18 TaxID=2964667 RepID=UPI0021C49ADC|nr:SRPBCC family protein [Rhizobium sp. NRK18]MCQ2002460.1 SRPBCC family protein [Rhizobium sp. NRK18]